MAEEQVKLSIMLLTPQSQHPECLARVGWGGSGGGGRGGWGSSVAISTHLFWYIVHEKWFELSCPHHRSCCFCYRWFSFSLLCTIKTYLPRRTHLPEADLYEVLLHLFYKDVVLTLSIGRVLHKICFICRVLHKICLIENVWIPIKISLKFVPKGPINNIPPLVQMMAWRRPGDKPLSEPMVVSLYTHMHICVTWPQWVKANIPTLSIKLSLVTQFILYLFVISEHKC